MKIICAGVGFGSGTETGIELKLLPLQWVPDGRRLITGAVSGEFTLWNGLTFNFESILQVTTRVFEVVLLQKAGWELASFPGPFSSSSLGLGTRLGGSLRTGCVIVYTLVSLPFLHRATTVLYAAWNGVTMAHGW